MRDPEVPYPPWYMSERVSNLLLLASIPFCFGGFGTMFYGLKLDSSWLDAHASSTHPPPPWPAWVWVGCAVGWVMWIVLFMLGLIVQVWRVHGRPIGRTDTIILPDEDLPS